jgi:hypothetical protein
MTPFSSGWISLPPENAWVNQAMTAADQEPPLAEAAWAGTPARPIHITTAKVTVFRTMAILLPLIA